jgi:ribosomal protein S18 acetylase RimI-like enzyme
VNPVVKVSFGATRMAGDQPVTPIRRFAHVTQMPPGRTLQGLNVERLCGMGGRVRRVTEEDVARLKAVRLAALTDSPFAFGSTLEREIAFSDDQWLERARSGATGDARATFLAEDAHDIVGLVGGYLDGEPDTRVELVSMWVAPSHRRRGIGRALVDAVLRWTVDVGGTSVALWVTRGNTPAEELYRSLGFEATGEFKPLPSDPCEEELRMEIRVPSE